MAIYSQTSLPVPLLPNGTSAPVTGGVTGFVESASSGPVGQSYSLFSVQVATTGSPTFSVQLQGSLDGANWFSVGAAITATGLSVVGTANQAVPYLRANLTSLSTGTIGVYAVGAA